jgi:hypothetical protein
VFLFANRATRGGEGVFQQGEIEDDIIRDINIFHFESEGVARKKMFFCFISSYSS